ncbi:MAG: flagellar basal body P-ring protein FlgI [Acidobacteriota bacterium]
MMRRSLVIVLSVLLVVAVEPLHATRLKDLASVEGIRENQLVGYGLVVGLNGTGDRRQTVFSAQSLTNMLQRMGVTVSPTAIQAKNTAAVMITASLPPFARPGMNVDVSVSTIGDSTNLQGGILIVSPLRGLDGQVYASAQGSVVTGGFSAASSGSSKTLNHPTSGRVPSGAIVERPAPSVIPEGSVRWLLHRADFTTAERIANEINQAFAKDAVSIASAESSGTVQVRIPESYSGRTSTFIADLEVIKVNADRAARVVINERTGTIVIGGDVSIAPTSILHGALSVEVQTEYQVSQPGPFSTGTTEVVPKITLSVGEEKAKSIPLPNGATVEELVRALTAIGATPRDIIAILQSLKASGALDADLEVL